MPISVKSSCRNMNHGRRDAPVRGCPDCGEVVNPRLPQRACSEDEHARRRRGQATYCVDCGKRLIGSR